MWENDSLPSTCRQHDITEAKYRLRLSFEKSNFLSKLFTQKTEFIFQARQSETNVLFFYWWKHG